MKRIVFILAAAILFACQTRKEEGFTLEISLDPSISGEAYLQDRVAGLMIDLDTASIDHGMIRFSGEVEYPQMYYLRIDGVAGRLAVFVENSSIKVDITSIEPVEYKVTGSASHDVYDKLSVLVEPYDERLRFLQGEIRKADEDEDEVLLERLRKQEAEVTALKRESIKELVKEFPGKTVSVFIAQRQLTHGTGPEELREIFNMFDPSLRGTSYYDAFETSLLALERVAIGNPAVDFTLENTDGQKVSLSDFRGQVVLISFWASWCPYCRVENPNLVRVYEKFGNDNFEVLGVSLDRTKDAWLQGIEEDGLEWVHVSDLQGWRSGPAAEYAVRSIPQNVLIDQNGTIIARNLKYFELEEKLPVLLGGV